MLKTLFLNTGPALIRHKSYPGDDGPDYAKPRRDYAVQPSGVRGGYWRTD